LGDGAGHHICGQKDASGAGSIYDGVTFGMAFRGLDDGDGIAFRACTRTGENMVGTGIRTHLYR